MALFCFELSVQCILIERGLNMATVPHSSPLSSTLSVSFVGNFHLLAFIEALLFLIPGFIVYLELLRKGQDLLGNEDIKFKLVIVKLLKPSPWVESIP